MREEIQSGKGDGGGDHLLGRRRHPSHQPHLREDGTPPIGSHCPTGGAQARELSSGWEWPRRGWQRWRRRRQQSQTHSQRVRDRARPVATLSDPGTGRNKGGISPHMVPANTSTADPVMPSWASVATAARQASSEGEAAAVTAASSTAVAEGPTTGGGCPAAIKFAAPTVRIRQFRISYKMRMLQCSLSYKKMIN